MEKRARTHVASTASLSASWVSWIASNTRSVFRNCPCCSSPGVSSFRDSPPVKPFRWYRRWRKLGWRWRRWFAWKWEPTAAENRLHPARATRPSTPPGNQALLVVVVETERCNFPQIWNQWHQRLQLLRRFCSICRCRVYLFACTLARLHACWMTNQDNIESVH